MKRNIFHLMGIGLIISILLFTACAEKETVSANTEVVDSVTEEEENRAVLGAYNPNTIRYINQEVLLYEEPSETSESLGNMTKFSEVEWVKDKTLDTGEIWSKVRYVILDHFVEGWVPAQALTQKIGADFREAFTHLDFNPKYKVDQYQNNPRVEAKAVYVSLHSAISNIDKFIELANETQINAFVIDVKDDFGYMLFHSKAAETYCPSANVNFAIKDMKAFMKKLKDNNIYAIARIVTFKDTMYVDEYPERIITYKSSGKPYKSRDDMYWASPHDRQLWEYDVAVAKEAADYGFNEIQFDYVRFPALSASKEAQLDFRKTEEETEAETIQKFLNYAYDALSEKEVYVAADIYGQVGSVADDMGIGQYWEAVSNEIDYVSPMMYPSHYGEGVYGLSVPDAYPYETVYHCAKDSLERNENISTPALIRPWIQDFTAPWVIGHISYGIQELEEQIKALQDLGIHEFMLWNPANKYHEEALK